ncbi:matrix-remodeling-associated protein 5-like isoform X2 [Stylophora pistillata]|uniref:matrix-remodeling-associated protein 5-like isoform X2 n=1 Tax=Stylophora pistillata TaxID=50429 RepID=UPI000C050F0F|nr:matrix-remodeling-associated protein 5-like isoform X2 [Stylophora pistillata]
MFAYAILLENLLLYGVFCSSAKGLSRVPVRIHQRVSLHIPSIQLENGTEIGWFSCPTMSCHLGWNEHFLADITFMTKVSVDDPNLDVYPNGTLAIKKVLPIYDGRYFIMRVHLKNRTSKAYSSQIKIDKEPPTMTLISQQNIHVYVGMDLHLEAEVRAYPYPRVSLIHVVWTEQHVVKNISNDFSSSEIKLKVPNITKSGDGSYIIFAENALGNHNLTVRVYVQDLSCSISTCTTPTDLPSSTLTTPTDNPGDQECYTYKVHFYVCLAFLSLVIVTIIFLKRRTLLSFVTRTCRAQVINQRNINLHV